MYTHTPSNYVCPFCAIAQNTFQSEKVELITQPEDVVLQNQFVTAFIASHFWQNNLGHVLLIPNAHYENIYTLPADYATHIHTVAQKIALAMKASYHCDGISTRQHNEPAGNQDVWHYHLHVFPRYLNDNLYQTPRSDILPAPARASYANRLKESLIQFE